MRRNLWIYLLLISLISTACSPSGTPVRQDETGQPARLRVVATTTIVADVVKNIAGDRVDLHVLIPAGVDEHSFQYTPEDVVQVTDADVLFMNGAGLETFMKPLLENAGQHVKVVSVSDGISLKQGVLEDALAAQTGSQPVSGSDPHVWLDPNNVMVWTQNIAAALSELDAPHASEYQANAAAYRQKLAELDRWIQQQVAQVPQANRQLVTDHQIFTYFADRYGFKQTGAIIPSYSTEAEPTAQELAALEDAIRQFGVKAIFVGNTVNPNLAKGVAGDTNVHLTPIYTGSLTDGSPAGTYLDYMHFNVDAIVQALK